jgi:hypothetical protein
MNPETLSQAKVEHRAFGAGAYKPRGNDAAGV